MHRWVGLVIAGFLLIAGITGSVIAFFADLDAALNPELFRVEPPAAGAPLLDPLELQARILRQLPAGGDLRGVVLDLREGESANYYFNERENFFDPYTGRALGSRNFGDLSEGKQNLLTFVYRLHYSLALGDVGVYVFGVVALLWTIDCFVGAYLTFPVATPAAGARPRGAWLRRWARAWGIETKQLFSLVFTWHRASGLWVWGMLLVFAWSAVALNLGEQVYEPLMNRVLPHTEQPEPPAIDPPRQHPQLGVAAALERGRELMASEAKQRGFRIFREKYLDYDPEHGAYWLTVESSLDIGERLADTAVMFDGDAGQLLAFRSPTTEGARKTFDRWLIALHFGTWREGGIVYRAFVCVMGAMVSLLSITGVWIWWRKRMKRMKSARRATARSTGSDGSRSARRADDLLQAR